MTERQAQTMAFIKSYIAEHGHSPSYEEIMSAVGWRSKNSVSRVVMALYDQGKITLRPYCARSIEVVQA